MIRRGGDPNIGPRLPGLLRQCGFDEVGVAAAQPINTQGELINPVTMENTSARSRRMGCAHMREMRVEFAGSADYRAGAQLALSARPLWKAG